MGSFMSHFLVVNTGRAVIHAGEEEFDVTPGRAAIVAPGTDAIQVEYFGTRTEVATLVLDCHPRSLWEGRAGVEGSSDPSINAFAFSAFCGLALSPVPTTRRAAQQLEAAAQLLARSLLSEDDSSSVVSYYESAMRFIRTNAVDVNLSPEMVAEHFRISIRKLQLEFNKMGTTPVSAIRRTRADAAVQIRAMYPGIDPATLASKSGFGSSRSMRRVMNELGV